MKNFNYNLLLATTAILSTGLVMGVMAETNLASGNIDVKVGFVNAIEIEQEHNLDFGLIKNRIANGTVTISSNGDEPTVTGEGMSVISGTSQRGVLHLDYIDPYFYNRTGKIDNTEYFRLVLPEEIRLSRDLDNHVCGYVTDLESAQLDSDDFMNSTSAFVNIGGKFTVKAKEGESLANIGNCTGTASITLMLGYQ